VDGDASRFAIMAAKPVFTKEQMHLIHDAAARVWAAKFKGEKGAQAKMALALGISQQSISNLLKRTYRPGLKVATEIAILDGRGSLEELVGVVAEAEPPERSIVTLGGAVDDGPFANLTICVKFFASTKHWSPWTIAAARAGFFGNADFAAPEWASKLDHLEKALERARKGA
jgi:transcriptional regulator with XRE-family HTH domain